MGDRLDLTDLMDEGGWPYADQTAGRVGPEPIDLRSDADDDLVALHALRRGALAGLSADERHAVLARFGLGGAPPMSMIELRTELGLSRQRTRVALSGGLAKLRQALADDGR
jgi:DNA-directed RNA polymerase specialized sigma24 family protein